jgi:hypothetical protein
MTPSNPFKEYAVLALGSSTLSKEHYESRLQGATFFDDIKLLWQGFFTRHGCEHEYLLVISGDWCLPQPFGASLITAVEEAKRTHRDTWILLGNAGVLPDGSWRSYRRASYTNPGLRKELLRCLYVDNGLFVVNLKRLSNLPLEKHISTSENLALELGFAGLDQGLFSFSSPSLFASELSSFHQSETPEEEYYTSMPHLTSHRLLLQNRMHENVVANYDFLHLPRKPGVEQRDIYSTYDRALELEATPAHAVEIVIRTILNRPPLLARSIESIAHLAAMAPSYIDVKVRLVSDRSGEVLQDAVSEASERWPHLAIEGSVFALQEGRYSRMDLLLQSIASSKADHLWFLDDDDFVMPPAIEGLARLLRSNPRAAIIGEASYYDETWHEYRLACFKRKQKTIAQDVEKVFSGENYVPICCMILPVQHLQQALQGVQARGDYLEDYFILMHYLARFAHTVWATPLELCGISLRGQENTVSKIDIRRWEMSYAEVMHEVLALNNATIKVAP